jgi:hypothetical protein
MSDKVERRRSSTPWRSKEPWNGILLGAQCKRTTWGYHNDIAAVLARNAGIAIADARFALDRRAHRPRASIPDNASMRRQHVFAQPRPIAVLRWVEIPQRSTLLQNRGVISSSQEP